MNTIIPHSSRFTLKTSTWELCPSPLRTISISIAIGDGTETRSTLRAVGVLFSPMVSGWAGRRAGGRAAGKEFVRAVSQKP